MTCEQPKPRSVADLGAKLDHLEGILGAELPGRTFEQRRQAAHVGTSPPQFNKKRKGTQQTRDHELARLVDLFRLGPRFDFRLFHLPFPEFEAALREAGVGTHGGPLSLRHRKTLLGAADRSRRIVILPLGRGGGPDRAVGGIGADAGEPDLPTLRPFERIALTVPLSAEGEDGHLIVLNDHPAEDQIACLMPSVYARETRVRGRDVRLPLEGDHPAFTVGRPVGFYRLFAVWSRRPLTEHLDLPTGPVDGVPDLAPQALGRLAQLAERTDPRSGAPVLRITTADYRVWE